MIHKKVKRRKAINHLAKFMFLLATLLTLSVLGILLCQIFLDGKEYVTLDFITSFPSRFYEKSGIWAAIWGTIWVMAVTIPLSFMIGVGTAIYLEEYAKKTMFATFIQMNIANLAGVPSIVFGLLGLTIFVRFMGWGQSVLSGGLTMTLVVLPIIVVAAQEAIKTVPKELKEASFAMGATKWQTTIHVVLPAALPGILTGTILAISRAIGETAPLLVIGAMAYVAFVPDGLLSAFTVLPIQIFNWTTRPQEEFHGLAAAGIIVLMIILFIMNGLAIWLRNKFQNTSRK
ncbi:phosphate ABC transporter permease PstA [Fictibacillus gelatini]|uniref:phosphate ABC transporter permease PstA n=1 Tax=Fictibacillus gelatini TaxID=225985 RepID=UPI0004105059|nr:phosphate ABC transporter permease PstA [Fictibacillus gelatini]